MKIRAIAATMLCMTCIVLHTGRAFAQGQELQQLILDIEKLTQLKGILSDMKTGYQIYQQGYGSISYLAKGNFNLHAGYLNGLFAISPAVRNYSRVAEILTLQASLISEYKQKQAVFRQSGSFSIAELSYMGGVYTRLVTQTLDDAAELADVLASGKLRMSDAERIRAIDRIYAGSSERLQFLRAFDNQGLSLSLQRSHESGDTRVLHQLYGLK